jgi:protein SCO1/2
MFPVAPDWPSLYITHMTPHTTQPRQRARLALIIAAIAIFLAVAGAVFWLSEQQARRMNVGIPDFRGDLFTLVDQTGAERRPEDFAGAPVALFYGYTYCPDVCPMTLTLLANALDDVAARGIDTGPLQTLLITVDADRDTPDQLAAYLSLFDMAVTGLTGSAAQLDAARRAFGAYAKRVEDKDGVVLFDHSATVFLFDADGRFTGTIVFNEPPEFVVEKLARLFAGT